jgi:hypothetical protein
MYVTQKDTLVRRVPKERINTQKDTLVRRVPKERINTTGMPY